MKKENLKHLYAEHVGKVSDKWSIYLEEYDHLFAPYRDRPVSILEIGIQNGGSLEIWSKFFEASSRIIGCDINPDCRKLQYSDEKIRVVVGDANTDEVENEVRSVSPTLDIVIDDGSHRSSDIVRSFARYFPLVTSGGIFVAEDLHCSYWENFEGGLFHPLSSIAFFKRLADVISHEHWGIPKARSEVLKNFFSAYGCTMSDAVLSEIHSIEFINSICVVRKRPPSDNELGTRFVTSGLAEVVPVVQQLHGTRMTPLGQSANSFSQIAPEDDLTEKQRAIDKLQKEVDSLSEIVRQMTQSRSWRFTRPLRWLVGQQQRLRDQGAATRLKKLVKKVLLKLARSAAQFLKSHPELLNRILKTATQLGIADRLRKVYRRVQQHPNDAVAQLRETLVASYLEWSAHFDTPSEDALKRMASTESRQPLITILATFDAVTAQHASALASCLKNSVGQPWTAFFLFEKNVDASRYARDVQQAVYSDSRISFNLPEASQLTELLVLIEGGALPRPHALRIFAETLEEHHAARLAYADEDRLLDGAEFADPWFKPSFSPLLVQQGMLLGRMTAIRVTQPSSLLDQMVRAPELLADMVRGLALEAGERLVIHIPHVLFHDALPATSPLPLRLEDPSEWPMASVVIPTRDRWDLLGPCLKSLQSTAWPSGRLEIIVVDNGSTDPTTLSQLSGARESGQIRLIRDDQQFNWSRLNNLAARQAAGELLVFLNNDTEVNDANWLKKLAVHALRPGTGAVGCKLLFEDRTVQHGGVIAGIQGVAGHAHLFLKADGSGYRQLATTTHEVSAVTGACLAVSRTNFEAVGGFDEDFRVAFNDTAFCFSLHKLGKRNVYVADPLFIHYESKSRGYDDTPEKKALNQAEARKAWQRHADLMRADPFYSPNLSLWSPYELTSAPRRKSAWDKRSGRPLRVMLLSITHAVGHGVPVVLSIHAAALVKHGYEVLVAGPRTERDFPYPGCDRVEVHDPLSAATLASLHGIDVIIAHTPPFYNVARWTGAHPVVIAYDHGEPPPAWFPDAKERESLLAEKDQSLVMATAVYAISAAIRSESRTPVTGVIPLGNAHLGQWSGGHDARRLAVRTRRGWQDKFVVLNVCRFHNSERRYKGVDLYAEVFGKAKRLQDASTKEIIFVLCGKGTPADVAAMNSLGLTVEANVTDDEMTDLYCAADAYANFSQWEGYNLGIGQALAMGLPVIASDIPAHRAFGIETTNDTSKAAEWVLRHVGTLPVREPKVWSWDAPCQRLIEVIETTAQGTITAEDPAGANAPRT